MKNKIEQIIYNDGDVEFAEILFAGKDSSKHCFDKEFGLCVEWMKQQEIGFDQYYKLIESQANAMIKL